MAKIRFTLVLPSKIAKILESRARKLDITKSELIKKAIIMYDYLQTETTENGAAVLLKDKEKNEEKEIIFTR